jgi:hypothetical protein
MHLTPEDIQEIRCMYSERTHSLVDLAIIFESDARYLHKVVHYEVRANVPDVEGFVRRPKRKYNKTVLVAAEQTVI